MNRPFASVVICTYNRADLLRKSLTSLIALEVDFDFEIVVIDNSSTDHTKSVIDDAIRTSRVPIRGFVESKTGVSAARNRGIHEAQGEWIASIDDDETADQRWLRELVATALARNVRCVGGRVVLDLPAEEVEKLSVHCRGLLGESPWGTGEKKYEGNSMPGAGNLLLHRSVFEEVGTFDEGLIEGGEDTDLFRRIRAAGIEAWYTPKAIIHHHVPSYRLSPKYLLWSAERNGWHVAVRDRRRGGFARFATMMAIRVGQLSLKFFPNYLLARLKRDSREVLGARCLLRRTRAYLQCGLNLTVPQVFPGCQLDFRSEREIFSSPSLQ